MPAQNPTRKRVVIASGGTGGHFYPAFSLGLALKAKGYEVLFLLPRGGSALEGVRRQGMEGVELGLIGLSRKPGWSWFTFIHRLLTGIRGIYFILRSYRPRAVAGMGSYLSFPAVLSAFFLDIPSIVHESNAQLGLANFFSRPFVKEIALGLPLEREPARCRVVLLGTPIRETLRPPAPAEECRRRLGLSDARKTLLVFGGSQGAQGLNDLVALAMAILASRNVSWFQCLHLTGPRSFEPVQQAYRSLKLGIHALRYLEEMGLAYGAADLVVCRAGAGTLAELIALKKPALLIPYPHAAADHQLANARLMEDRGCALVFPENQTAPGTLAEEIARLLNTDPPALEAMRRAYAGAGFPDPFLAAGRLAERVESLLGEG